MSQITQLTEHNFAERVLNSERPVLVDFYADWCGPCKAQNPTLAALAEDYAGRVDVVKLDVDESQALAQAHGVRSIPTLVLFKGGEAIATRVGLSAKDELAALLDSAA
jgi:thioredoxin 1